MKIELTGNAEQRAQILATNEVRISSVPFPVGTKLTGTLKSSPFIIDGANDSKSVKGNFEIELNGKKVEIMLPCKPIALYGNAGEKYQFAVTEVDFTTPDGKKIQGKTCSDFKLIN